VQVLVVQVVELQLQDVELLEVETQFQPQLTFTSTNRRSHSRSLELVSEEAVELELVELPSPPGKLI
jgi:hypothetical protein